VPYSILVCDPDAMRCHLVATYLIDCGFAVTSFSEAASALAAVRADPYAFDLVIDAGACLVRSMRAIEPPVDVVVIEQSGTAQPRLRLVEPGVVKVYAPFKQATLKRAIDAVLESGLRTAMAS
jgi:DNA-binding response OmpR family regulator